MALLLDVEGLTIATARGTILVNKIGFTVEPGEIVGIVGESGSGKTMVAKSVLRLLPPGVEQTSGIIRLDSCEIGTLSKTAMRGMRGSRVGMIFQEPMTSLNPSMTIGRQMEEGLVIHRSATAGERKKLILAMLARVGIKDPENALDAYPHQFSGGMRQRIMIASVMLVEPVLLIADEPTTALDAILQNDVLDLMVELARENNTAVLLVSHDLSMIARYTQRIIVMANGEVMEHGQTEAVMTNPVHPYTRKLLASVPRRRPTRTIPVKEPVVRIEGLSVEYPDGGFAWRPALKRVVHEVDLAIAPGEVIAVVGESGSGKTTIGRAVAGLLQPADGRILFDGNVIRKGNVHYRDYRRNCQMVFQDPYSSLDPRMTIGGLVGEPLRHIEGIRGRDKQQRVRDTLKEVGLGVGIASRLPHQLSGGQRQRVAIARAIIGRPRLIIADEPVSALDVTVRAQILALLRSLQEQYAFSCLFISHDLGVVEEIADRVVVMKSGRIVETGTRDEIFDNPQHDYTKRLLHAAGRSIRDCKEKSATTRLFQET